MAESDRFLNTVEAIYAAGLEPDLWAQALGRISQLFGAAGTTYEIFQKKPLKLIDLHVVGLPPEAETAYLEHYSKNNPRAAYAFRHLSEATLCDYQLIDERAMDRDAYYAKYLGSLGLRYFLSGQIVNTPTIQGIVSIQRSRRQGHVERRDVERMRRLLPHLRRAHDMSARLKIAGAAQRSLEQTLDLLVDGVALVDADARLVHTNAAFDAVARGQDGIRVVRNRIEPVPRDARIRFAAALAAAADLQMTRHAATDLLVERPSGKPAYLVSLRPLAVARRRSPGAAVAIVFIRDPLAGAALTVPMLQHVFGLTDAEANLATALRAGISPAGYARTRALSRNTIYTHLRRLKEKTRSTRLPELIHKLGSVTPAVFGAHEISGKSD